MADAVADAPRDLHQAAKVPRFHYAVPQSLYGTVIFMPMLVDHDSFLEWVRWHGMSYVWTVLNFTVQVLFLHGVHEVCKTERMNLVEAGDDCEALLPSLLAVGMFACCVAVLTDVQETFDITYLVWYQVPTVKQTSILKFQNDADGNLRPVEGGFSTARKVCVTCFFLFPKLLLAFGLLTLGFTFLAISPSNMDIILNSTALIYIIEVDEAMFSFFSLPEVRCIMEAVPSFDVQRTQWQSLRGVFQFGKMFICIVLTIFAMYNFRWCGNEGLFLPLLDYSE